MNKKSPIFADRRDVTNLVLKQIHVETILSKSNGIVKILVKMLYNYATSPLPSNVHINTVLTIGEKVFCVYWYSALI